MILSLFVAVALAQTPVPDPYVAIGVGGGMPAQSGQARATVNAGETVTLRAVQLGGQRAWCMNPERHAPVGRNTTIDSRGMSGCSYTVSTPGFHRSGSWRVTKEHYTWSGTGLTFTPSRDPQRVTVVAPQTPGEIVVSVSGEVSWRLDSVVQRELTDRGTGTLVLTVTGTASKLTADQARSLILRNFFDRIPDGTVRGQGLTWVASPGFANNLWALMGYRRYNNTSCGGYQSMVLKVLDDLRRHGNDTEQAIFDHFDYGPIHAYHGGHQAVVIFPKGTDWNTTGLVFDPWPEQRPMTYEIADWKKRFSFGVGPSSVYSGQYPITGSSDYPGAGMPLADQMAVYGSLSDAEKARIRSLPEGDRPAELQRIADERKRVAVSVHSPVRLLVRARDGRRVGYLPNGRFVYEIPGTDVDLFPSADGHRGAVYFLPEQDYDIFAYPYQEGTFDLAYVKHRDRPGEAIQRWQGLAAVPGSPVSLTLRPADAYVPWLKDPTGRVIEPTLEQASPRRRDQLRDALRCDALSMVVPGAGLVGLGVLLLRRRRRADPAARAPARRA